MKRLALVADPARYGRQMRLAEIGFGGQMRLLACDAPLGGGGFAREIESLYLARAGARPVDGEATPCSVDLSAFEHGAARDVAEGAFRALLVMRHVLGIGDT